MTLRTVRFGAMAPYCSTQSSVTLPYGMSPKKVKGVSPHSVGAGEVRLAGRPVYKMER